MNTEPAFGRTLNLMAFLQRALRSSCMAPLLSGFERLSQAKLSKSRTWGL